MGFHQLMSVVKGHSMAKGPKRVRLARALRQQAVPAEALLWKVVRNRAMGGFKFRRQHPIGPYVVDFACVECKIVLELDGGTHLRRHEADTKRTCFLEAEGWQVLRFWNTQIYDDLESVKGAIYQICVRRS
jgi:very-short-patch-repair endonuclease